MYDVAIIGCGPAGLSAAIYTARAQLKTILFGDPTKGNLYKSHIIGNYFGFPETITGPALTEKGLEHIKKLNAEHQNVEIVDIRLNDDGQFILKDSTQKEIESKTVIIATGQSYALSGIKNEKELTGKGVSYCVICDGYFFRNKEVVVIGHGNYAAEEALQLLNYTQKIKILSHGKEFNFSSEMETALKKTSIVLEKTVRIKEIAGAHKAEKLIFTDGTEHPTEGVFMAVGVAGAVSFAKKLGIEMNGSYIKVNMEGQTNIPGLFAAGDCTGSPPQVATSVGNGCNAALSAIKKLRGVKVYLQYE